MKCVVGSADTQQQQHRHQNIAKKHEKKQSKAKQKQKTNKKTKQKSIDKKQINTHRHDADTFHHLSPFSNSLFGRGYLHISLHQEGRAALVIYLNYKSLTAEPCDRILRDDELMTSVVKEEEKKKKRRKKEMKTIEKKTKNKEF